MLKTAPEVVASHLTAIIGAPRDYMSNKERGEFAEHYDLRIPANPDANESLSKEDLAGALEGVQLENGNRDSSARNYEKSAGLVKAAASPSYDEYMPVKALNQFSSDWCIKARITKKNDVRSWKNARGEGQLLNIDLIDKEGTRIQATAFNETANKFDVELEENCVYTFTNGQVKLANKKYTSIKNDYCLTFDQNTIVQKCDDDLDIKETGFSFSSLDQIDSMNGQATVDVLGIVLDVQPTSSITLRNGDQKNKRTLTIGDDNNMMI